MVIVLPIIPMFRNANQAWKLISDRAGLDLKYLAELVLIYTNDKPRYIAEVIDYIYATMDDQDVEDNDLTRFNDVSIQTFLKSAAFELFLQMFYDEHKKLYEHLLGVHTGSLEWSVLYDNSLCSKDKLILDMEIWE